LFIYTTELLLGLVFAFFRNILTISKKFLLVNFTTKKYLLIFSYKKECINCLFRYMNCTFKLLQHKSTPIQLSNGNNRGRSEICNTLH